MVGPGKAIFSLYPVRNGGAGEFQYQSGEFQGWLGKMRYVSNTPADLAERTLNPEDGL
jgi:hypothetical protein